MYLTFKAVLAVTVDGMVEHLGPCENIYIMTPQKAGIKKNHQMLTGTQSTT